MSTLQSVDRHCWKPTECWSAWHVDRQKNIVRDVSTQHLDWLRDMSIDSVDCHVVGSVDAPYRGPTTFWTNWSGPYVCPRIWKILTPNFSSPLAKTSAPFFWLTKIITGGSTPRLNISINLRRLSCSVTMHTICSVLSVGLPMDPM